MRPYDGRMAPWTLEGRGYRPVFARISPEFVGSLEQWFGRASIVPHPVEIRADLGAEGVGLCGRATACV